jgi:hypothetical protein
MNMAQLTHELSKSPAVGVLPTKKPDLVQLWVKTKVNAQKVTGYSSEEEDSGRSGTSSTSTPNNNYRVGDVDIDVLHITTAQAETDLIREYAADVNKYDILGHVNLVNNKLKNLEELTNGYTTPIAKVVFAARVFRELLTTFEAWLNTKSAFVEAREKVHRMILIAVRTGEKVDTAADLQSWFTHLNTEVTICYQEMKKKDTKTVEIPNRNNLLYFWREGNVEKGDTLEKVDISDV